MPSLSAKGYPIGKPRNGTHRSTQAVCVWCGRSFLAKFSRLRATKHGHFCTRGCFYTAMRGFNELNELVCATGVKGETYWGNVIAELEGKRRERAAQAA